MHPGDIHPGWILGSVLYALFMALMAPPEKGRYGRLGNGGILQEFVLQLLLIAILGGFMLFLTGPISGGLWKLHPVYDYGGIWAIAVGFPLTLFLAALVFAGVKRIIFPPKAPTAPATPASPDAPAAPDTAPDPVPAADATPAPDVVPRPWWQRPRPIRPAGRPSPHDPNTPATPAAPTRPGTRPAGIPGATPGSATGTVASTGAASTTGATTARPAPLAKPAGSRPLPASATRGTSSPAPAATRGTPPTAPAAGHTPTPVPAAGHASSAGPVAAVERGRFTRAPKPKQPFDGDAWVRAIFRKYFFLVIGSLFCIMSLVDMSAGDSGAGAAGGGLLLGVVFLMAAWFAHREMKRY